MGRTGKLAAAPALVLLLASGAAPLKTGAWEILNTPGVAALDGQALNELPIEPVTSSRICLTAKDAADPAAFFNRDMDSACKISKSSAAGGEVHIAGTCPNQVGEGPEGQFELKGKFDSTSYDIDFATIAFGENGKMTFSGNLKGRHLGSCTDA